MVKICERLRWTPKMWWRAVEVPFGHLITLFFNLPFLFQPRDAVAFVGVVNWSGPRGDSRQQQQRTRTDGSLDRLSLRCFLRSLPLWLSQNSPFALLSAAPCFSRFPSSPDPLLLSPPTPSVFWLLSFLLIHPPLFFL